MMDELISAGVEMKLHAASYHWIPTAVLKTKLEKTYHVWLKANGELAFSEQTETAPI